MLDQIIIAGATGAIIILSIFGFAKIIQVIKKNKEGISLKESILSILGKSFVSWIATIFFVLFCSMIVSGIIISIIFE
jgi:hypothetical protein